MASSAAKPRTSSTSIGGVEPGGFGSNDPCGASSQGRAGVLDRTGSVGRMPTTESSDDLRKWSFTMAKNPFMSAYLSAANRVANTARGKATNEIKRQSKRQTTSMVNAWVDAWTPKPKAKPARKRKTR
jgi:hypothetical protein